MPWRHTILVLPAVKLHAGPGSPRGWFMGDEFLECLSAVQYRQCKCNHLQRLHVRRELETTERDTNAIT